MNQLIDCKTCKKQLAATAVACPSCDAPNDWKHEDIARFLAACNSIGTKRPFNYEVTKTAVTGQTALRSPMWARAVGVVIFLVSVISVVGFAGTWWGPLIGGAMSVLVPRAFAKSEWFRADVQARTWASSDDVFWSPVRSFLRL